jgi:N-acetylneuraminate synthase
MTHAVDIAGRLVGDIHPVYIIAEIGINHNGDLDIAKKLIDAAVSAGCDAVKFQKRTPELCVPLEQRQVMRETPWGMMSYMDYRVQVEFGYEEYAEIDRYCREKGIQWTASCWDQPSVDFIEQFNPPFYKVASAALTDKDLLLYHWQYGRPIILSTGMSTLEEIDAAVNTLDKQNLVILHCNSSYPCKPEELNLNAIRTLQDRYGVPIGYSGHEIGLQTTVAAVALGACVVERHITLDRAMWGSDQAASVEPHGFQRLIRDIRVVESAMGDGVVRVYESEYAALRKLRRVG